MKNSIINIKKDGLYGFKDIQGCIKKICIKSEQPLSNVHLEFTTIDGEIIFSTTQSNSTVVLYPWNFIDSQGRGAEYYSHGDVYVQIEGMIEGQQINSVNLYYQ